MKTTVFTQVSFWLLVAFSIVIPFGIYWLLLHKRAIANTTVLLFGLALVVIAGMDVYLLQRLQSLAKASASLTDDAVFVSELSLALYLLPVMLGGVGINLISHILLKRLSVAEKRFEDERAGD
ncbi:MAG TPA: hypothetical protein VGO41_06360 [Steroidobacteraceae bacterium]|nr:hypothetical protein [Steroidobacteraceae bacterium]